MYLDYHPPGMCKPYSAWGSDHDIPLLTEDIFLDLMQKFGFQRDLMCNMVSFWLSVFVGRMMCLS
jgi:hypothetical protein